MTRSVTIVSKNMAAWSEKPEASVSKYVISDILSLNYKMGCRMAHILLSHVIFLDDVIRKVESELMASESARECLRLSGDVIHHFVLELFFVVFSNQQFAPNKNSI